MIRSDPRWVARLTFDPRPALISSDVEAVALFARRDLNGESVTIEQLWDCAEPQRIIGRQLENGSWKYPTKQSRSSAENYNQYETFKRLGTLVEKFGFHAGHPAIRRASEYLFDRQSDKGDLRGIYDRQYTPNYTAAIAELLIKAGYGDDPRIARVFDWLLATRQEDGGWALPFRTRGHSLDVTYAYPTTIEPDRSKPFSHMVTGVVLRAFAAHPRYRTLPEAKKAGRLLLDRLFKEDSYSDRRGAEYWLRFVFPFCYTDLISSLDSLSLLGFSARNERIDHALAWFVGKQSPTGLWDVRTTAGTSKDATRLWLALALCRIFKRLYG